jgi:hypothetical protein
MDTTYFTATIAATDSDGDPARVEVCASVGEFDGVVLNTFRDGQHALFELTLTGVDELLAALTAARAVLSR